MGEAKHEARSHFKANAAVGLHGAETFDEFLVAVARMKLGHRPTETLIIRVADQRLGDLGRHPSLAGAWRAGEDYGASSNRVDELLKPGFVEQGLFRNPPHGERSS